jgi:type I restriction enzyme S subunit
MSELPTGWKVKLLGDLIELNKKFKDVPEDTLCGFVPMGLIPVSITDKLRYEEKYWSDCRKGYTHFKNGDVLLAKITPCFENGKSALVEGLPNGIGSGSTEFFVMRPLDIEARYLHAFVKTKEFMDKCRVQMTGSVGHKRVPKDYLLSFPVPVAPLKEQKRIADKLDSVLAKVEAAQARLDKIPVILKRFRQSVLAAATSGELTKVSRGTPSISRNQSPITIGNESKESPIGWEWFRLTDLAKLESGHTPRKSRPEYWEKGDQYWICLQDIRAAHGKVINDTKYKPTQLGIDNSSARMLPKGTVCFSRDISVGFTTIMGRSMSTTQHFANWICGDKLSNKYLLYSFMAAQGYLTTSGQGTTVKTIYMPALKELHLLLPNMDEQLDIVRRVEELLNSADAIEKQFRAAKVRLDKLTQSILAKAFRGELLTSSVDSDIEAIENSVEALNA